MTTTKTKEVTMTDQQVQKSIDGAWVGLFFGALLIGGAGLVAQYSDPSFDEMVRGDVTHILPNYSDGTMMAGDFGEHRLAYVNSQGDFYRFTDSSDSQFNGPIKQLHRAGESLIVGGQFTAYGQSLAGYIAKLNSNGELDTDFARNMGTGFDDEVDRIFMFRSLETWWSLANLGLTMATMWREWLTSEPTVHF
jgi:hypothetical protein